MTLPLGGESTARAHGADRIVIEEGYSPHVLRVWQRSKIIVLYLQCVCGGSSSYAAATAVPSPARRLLFDSCTRVPESQSRFDVFPQVTCPPSHPSSSPALPLSLPI